MDGKRKVDPIIKKNPKKIKMGEMNALRKPNFKEIV
jgi:hypothetical protein